MPGFSGIQVTAGQVIKFCCNYDVKWYSSTTQTQTIVGAFNVFINPNSSAQPNPSTPGVVRLSDPIVIGDDYYAGKTTDGY
jgi:hypothetical protein